VDEAAATPTLTGELAKALKGVVVDDRDRPAVLLAMKYAKAIDGDSDLLETLGSRFMTALQQLQLTPASRGAAGAGAPSRSPAEEALKAMRDEVAAKRRQRADSA
jgi:hypothetical protein